jgi:hypothetical protein
MFKAIQVQIFRTWISRCFKIYLIDMQTIKLPLTLSLLNTFSPVLLANVTH